MTQLFTASDYSLLHSLVFRDGYPGYKPNVVESPNGDGKLDDKKRYSHIAEKYLTQMSRNPDRARLEGFLDTAHAKALEVAVALGVPPAFWPSRTYSAMRVLEYGPDAITNQHTDFDLFTLMCYRNLPEYFKYRHSYAGNANTVIQGLNSAKMLKSVQPLNSQIHFGEILQEVNPSSFIATPHEVEASEGPYQYSIVFFAIPPHESVLPSGLTVGKWLEERLSRSRYER